MDKEYVDWYDAEKESELIELTEQQMQAVEGANAAPPCVLNTRTRETFVLLRVDEYERLKEEYDDSPWTSEERHALAWEAGKHAGWAEMGEYDENERSV